MATDAGSPQPEAPKAVFALPRVLAVRARRVALEPPARRNFASALEGGEGVEFLVTTEHPIPTRALAPALYVGDAVVTESTPVDRTTYRFVAWQPEVLERGAPIALGWTGQRRQERIATGFAFEDDEVG